MVDVEGKKLTELRVIDLKTELERRGLEKTGKKAALLERLSKALSDVGENPEEYLIVPCGGTCKTSPRKNSVTGVPNQDDTLESSENQKEEIVETIKKKNVDTQDTSNYLKAKSKPKLLPEENLVTKKEDTSNGTSDNSPKELEIKQETKTTTVNKTTSNQSSAIGAVEANGMDNVDSINLTIGEDEENLFAEETESYLCDRHKGGKMSRPTIEEEHLRHCMLFLFDQGMKANEAVNKITDTYGDVLNLNKCHRWFKKFKNGDRN